MFVHNHMLWLKAFQSWIYIRYESKRFDKRRVGKAVVYFRVCLFFFPQQAINNYWAGQKIHLGYEKSLNEFFGQPNTASFKQCSDMGRCELQTTLELCGDWFRGAYV